MGKCYSKDSESKTPEIKGNSAKCSSECLDCDGFICCLVIKGDAGNVKDIISVRPKASPASSPDSRPRQIEMVSSPTTRPYPSDVIEKRRRLAILDTSSISAEIR